MLSAINDSEKKLIQFHLLTTKALQGIYIRSHSAGSSHIGWHRSWRSMGVGRRIEAHLQATESGWCSICEMRLYLAALTLSRRDGARRKRAARHIMLRPRRDYTPIRRSGKNGVN